MSCALLTGSIGILRTTHSIRIRGNHLPRSPWFTKDGSRSRDEKPYHRALNWTYTIMVADGPGFPLAPTLAEGEGRTATARESAKLPDASRSSARALRPVPRGHCPGASCGRTAVPSVATTEKPMAKNPDAFIQISAVSYASGPMEPFALDRVELFALDGEGQVWRLKPNVDRAWIRVTPQRSTESKAAPRAR
jgi:hypothetical protein